MHVRSLSSHSLIPDWEQGCHLSAHHVSLRDVRQVLLAPLHYDHPTIGQFFLSAKFIVQQRDLEAVASQQDEIP